MAGQAKHKLGTMSSGSYDKSAHKGAGKAQKLLPPAAGKGYNSPTPHSAGAVVADGIGRGRGYQNDAHSTKYHGRQGEAVGHPDDNRPMSYRSELYSEGRPTSASGEGPTFVDKHDHTIAKGSHVVTHPIGLSTKADHHPPAAGATHKFSYMSAGGSHGYGHSPSQCSGPLRMSGHSRGHQVGKR